MEQISLFNNKKPEQQLLKFLQELWLVSDGDEIEITQSDLEKRLNDFMDCDVFWTAMAKLIEQGKIVFKNKKVPDEAGTEVNGYRIELMDIPF